MVTSWCVLGEFYYINCCFYLISPLLIFQLPNFSISDCFSGSVRLHFSSLVSSISGLVQWLRPLFIWQNGAQRIILEELCPIFIPTKFLISFIIINFEFSLQICITFVVLVQFSSCYIFCPLSNNIIKTRHTIQITLKMSSSHRCFSPVTCKASSNRPYG